LSGGSESAKLRSHVDERGNVMSDMDAMEELAARLVVSRKRDGRNVYDEQAKAQPVQACRQPGVSLARLARQCGVNAN